MVRRASEEQHLDMPRKLVQVLKKGNSFQDLLLREWLLMWQFLWQTTPQFNVLVQLLRCFMMVLFVYSQYTSYDSCYAISFVSAQVKHDNKSEHHWQLLC